MSDALLAGRGLEKSYAGGAGRIDVLRGLDIEVAAGEAVAVVGDSGVGKSTLLHLLGGLDRPDAGAVTFRGDEVSSAGAREIADYRNRNVGFVFQFHHLLPELTAQENVELPLQIGRRRPAEARRAAELLERLGLGARVRHYATALSGGEQQRVAIARALVAAPAVVLADEPTGNLDPGTAAEVFALLRELQRERGFAVVLATHSGRLAGGCDRILRLVDGRLRPLDESEARDYFGGVARGGSVGTML